MLSNKKAQQMLANDVLSIMRTTRHLIFGQFLTILVFMQFLGWQSGKCMYLGFPHSILWRRWRHGNLSTWQFEPDALVFDVIFLPVMIALFWFLIFKVKKLQLCWGKMPTLANICSFGGLMLLNIWYTIAHTPDFSEPGDVWYYGGGWPFPVALVPNYPDAPSEVAFTITDLGWLAGIFNPLIAMLVPIAVALAVTKIWGQNKEGDRESP